MEYQFSEKMRKYAADYNSVRLFTGAGISRESGVPTFRGKDGLWRKYDAAQLATPEAFASNPLLVWQWYDWRRSLIKSLEPNPGHYAVARMEKFYKDFVLITQNVDGLHARAGSRKILELHGNIWQLRCTREGTITESFDHPMAELPPKCACGALLRPHVVWFGEALDPETLSEAFREAAEAELFLIVGTSGLVFPAASIPVQAKNAGAYIVEVNPEPSQLTDIVDEFIQGPSGEVLPQLAAFIGID